MFIPDVVPAGSPNENPPTHAPSRSAVITNGTITLGANDQGHLNVPSGGPPSSGTGTMAVGLRFVQTSAEAIAPGCLCEGWGVGDGGRGISGFASVDLGGVSPNVVLQSFNATGATAISVVTVGGIFRVTHDFHPTPVTPFLYEVTVTIENISGAALTDVRYRRLMDWDIEPTAFNEFVTIDSGTAEHLAFVTDNGFDSPDPLLLPNLGGFTLGDRIDEGPDDHGALFQFEFGALAAGERLTFNIYYGATPTELEALSALAAVRAEAFSLGQPSDTPDGPTLGTPNTFIFGFSGVGGASIVGQIVLDPPFASNDVGATHTVTATVTEGGSPVAGTEVTFEVIVGPNQGKTAKVTTNSEGKAAFTYTGDGGVGTDEIRASFVAPATRVTINAPEIAKKWETIAGDVNGDGVRNALDAEELLRRLVLPDELSLIADMDGDGLSTNRDSILILGVGAGLIPPPPDRRRVDATDNDDGTITVTGDPGAAPSGSKEIHLTNTTSGALVSVPVQPDGSFGPLTIAAAPGNRLTLDVDRSPARLGNIFPVPFDLVDNFPVGRHPKSIAVDDFNSDGRLDLAVADTGANTVSVLLGNGDGTFRHAPPVAVGAGPEAMAVGDFNGDSKLDLAVANAGSDEVSVLLGNGDGTFQPVRHYPVGSVPAAIAVGDLNDDGVLDLVVVNEGSNNISQLLGDGLGNFAPVTAQEVGDTPTAIAVGDFDGNGAVDLAVSNGGDNNVSVLLNFPLARAE